MFAIFWLLLMCVPALALGGSASHPAGGAPAAASVMVLGSRGSACSGTVVAQDMVLTAAHCVEHAPQLAVAWFAAGKPVLVPAARALRHPQAHTGSAVSVDLALVKLGAPLPAAFRPVPLDGGSEAHALGLPRILAGYGMAADGDEASAGQSRSADTVVLPKLLPRFLRLGAPTGGMGAFMICEGDSGGGVFAPDGTLVAVIAQRERLNGGRTCGPVAQAVRIAPQIGWIRSAMQRLGQ